MRRAFRYRLYPSTSQAAKMLVILDRLRDLYNAALQERRDAYRKTGKSPSFIDQMASRRELKIACPEYTEVHSHLLCDALRRVDLAFKAFYRRCSAGDKPGYPRFKGHSRYRTFTFSDIKNGNGASVVNGGRRIRLAGIGNVRVKLHRPYEGVIKTISVTLDRSGRWYVRLSCDHVPTKPIPQTGAEVGIDLGIRSFAAMSDGPSFDNPRLLQAAARRLAIAHRKLSKHKRGSGRREKSRVLLAKQHAKVSNARKDFQHKVALAMVRRFDRIHIENLNVRGLASGFLSKQVRDAAWGQFIQILSDKAESAGRDLVRVNPRGTSQMCSGCGTEVPKDLSVRVHDCPHCGLVLDRDVNAARNILRLGQSLRGGPLVTAPSDPSSEYLYSRMPHCGTNGHAMTETKSLAR